MDWIGVARDMDEGRPGPECDRICGECIAFFPTHELWADIAHRRTLVIGECGVRSGLIGYYEDACEKWKGYE